MRVVIVAGGKGERLGKLSHSVPKPLVLVDGVTVIEHQIRLLKRYGLTDIRITTGHFAEKLESHLGDGEKESVSISYFREDKPLGTIGALAEFADWLGEDFLVFYADIMVEMSLSRLIDFHYAKNSDLTLVVHPNDHPDDSDLIETNADGRLTAVHPKPRTEKEYYPNLVNAGIFVMSERILASIPRNVAVDLGRDLLSTLICSHNVYGYQTPEYLKDIGTPSRVQEVTEDSKAGVINSKNLDKGLRAVFLDRDGVLNEEVSLLHRAEDLRLLPGAPEGLRKINRLGYMSVVVTNQPVVARNLCSVSDLQAIHNKLETLLGQHSTFVDAIYFCPHHPDSGFPEENPEYKVDCDCRKPKPGMILSATREWNIDLGQSWMIGDSMRDILAGRQAGVRTIAVSPLQKESGVEGDAAADYYARDLLDAAELLQMLEHKES